MDGLHFSLFTSLLYHLRVPLVTINFPLLYNFRQLSSDKTVFLHRETRKCWFGWLARIACCLPCQSSQPVSQPTMTTRTVQKSLQFVKLLAIYWCIGTRRNTMGGSIGSILKMNKGANSKLRHLFCTLMMVICMHKYKAYRDSWIINFFIVRIYFAYVLLSGISFKISRRWCRAVCFSDY